jgi:hypothetical protein
VPAVYSAELAHLLAAPAGDTSLGGPDGPVKWVIKQIDVIMLGGGFTPVPGFQLLDSDGVNIFGVKQPFSVQGYPYSWSGTQTVDPPQSLIFRTDLGGWDIRISGYILALP